MKCPICKADLSPLDLVSRNEHVDLCLENGPSVVDYNETGRLVVKKNIPPGKQRKICPICDKTFQTIHSHFKTCALKFDVPPSLMLDHWDMLNSGLSKPKKFPKDLLDNFIAKSVREGRLGDQVDFARALSISMAADGPDNTQASSSASSVIQQSYTTHPHASLESTADSNSCSSFATSNRDETNQGDEHLRPSGSNTASVDATPILMQSASSSSSSGPSRIRPPVPKVRYPLELVDDMTKAANIELRVDRELAATRSRRYEEALCRVGIGENDGNDCIILDNSPNEGGASEKMSDYDIRQELELDKMFFKARLKNCTESRSCQAGECTDHELNLRIPELEEPLNSKTDG